MEGLVVVCWLQRRRGIGLFRYPRERIPSKLVWIACVCQETSRIRFRANVMHIAHSHWTSMQRSWS